MKPDKRIGLSLLMQERCQSLKALDAASHSPHQTALSLFFFFPQTALLELSVCLYSQSKVRAC